MNMKQFSFIDFEPSRNLTDRAMERLSRIFGESPSESSTRAWVKKTRDGFEGRLQIRSAVGTFMADVIGEDPAQVIDSLSQKVRTQLQNWKRNRHLVDDAN
jgi:ribosome-associated translation inhibitor RaiA